MLIKVYTDRTKMWGEADFSSDLQLINQRQFLSLATGKGEPDDPALRHRFHFIQLLLQFRQNELTATKELANAFLPSCIEYMDSWKGFEQKPAPNFDFIVLVCMLSVSSIPTHSLFIKLFNFCIRVEKLLKASTEEKVYINDVTHPKEALMEHANALPIIERRVDYIAELIASLLHTQRQTTLLLTFLYDLCPPPVVHSEITLSILGRAALGFGEIQLSQKYFDLVKIPQHRAANEGFRQFYAGQFTEAKNSFAAGQINAKACDQYLGKLKSEDQSKKLSLEDRAQWPTSPK